MKITEQHLCDLLEETLPYLEFCVGGTNVDETLGKVKLVLKLARRHNKPITEHSDRTCVCACGHTKTCDPCGFYGAEEL
jgi:hypothetical protein